MWEMQGELGTSHAYEMGGDYRSSPNYAQGFLGADYTYDAENNGYRITHIPQGDAWEASKDSPLNAPGVNVTEGDILLAIGGQQVSETLSPGELLVNLANQEVQATFQNAEDSEKRVVTLKVLGGEHELRYREWVSQNRRYVHEKTDGKVGYVHIPDMGRRGYAEFHRGYLAEVSYPGLLIDVRYNGGGHVSQLLLEKLARRRIGYDVPRWGTPHPYPDASVLGPMIAVTNENAGSDGDIFSHCFKLMELGLLVGKRTWGGVIGISPHHPFVDGGGTTQPEYSFWFVDVGWRVENYGTDPDIEVDYRPQDYIAEGDPQLDRAIEELLRQMEENPPKLPDFGERPRLTLPTLPKA
jgi:tricorn protease